MAYMKVLCTLWTIQTSVYVTVSHICEHLNVYGHDYVS